MPAGGNPDFFLSRRGSVAAVAREVADILIGAGYKVSVQDYDIPLTTNFIAAMHDAITSARDLVLLTHAETAFRDMKSPLAERPIFHHIERRTEAHIFLCVLACHLLTAIEKTLLDQAIHTS